MRNRTLGRCMVAGALGALVLALQLTAGASAAPTAPVLGPDTAFSVPAPNRGALEHIKLLRKSGQTEDAALINALINVPQAVWITQGTPHEARKRAEKTIKDADKQDAIAVLVIYNIPIRDCGLYSAGGAQTTEAYAAWIDGLAHGIGDSEVIVLLEPDGLAAMDCQTPQQQADRLLQMNYAVDVLTELPNALVYLDGGNSRWQAVGNIAKRLVDGGVMRADGFFLNVSNYNTTEAEVWYGTWISKCIAFANNPEEGGWRLGHYDWCASQYFSPNGPVNPNDLSTWHYVDAWYDGAMGTAVPTIHFVVDTSRNGQGRWVPTASYPDAQDWCNPPGRGAGVPPTTDTGDPLVDALLWAKVPGESDGQCNRGIAGSTTDPEWGGIVDPPAGTWFPQQALQLARFANPPLIP